MNNKPGRYEDAPINIVSESETQHTLNN